jgi:hypothetical protein
LVRIRDKKDADGVPMYRMVVKPATDNGQEDGKPVFLTDERLKKLKMSEHFNTQQLCNPTPTTAVRLEYDWIQRIHQSKLPANRIKFMVVDPAGDSSVQDSGKSDRWAMLVLSVEPKMDDLGACNVYLEDMISGQMALNEAIDAACNLYMRNGRIALLGIEKTSNDTTYEHIRNALRAKGRYMQLKENEKSPGNMILLKPGGRAKNRRIEAALQWPLYNSKIFFCDNIEEKYLRMIREEMDKFPFYHVDILDAMAYLWDMLKLPRYLFGLVSTPTVDYSRVFLR